MKPRRRALLAAGLVGVVVVGLAITRNVTRSPSTATSRTGATASPGSATSTSPSSSVPPASTTTTKLAAARLQPGPALPAVPLPGEPVAGSSPEAIAAQLRDAWSAIGNPNASAIELARAAHVEQVVVRALAANGDPQFRSKTYAGLAASLRAHTVANVDAAAKLRSLVGKPRTSLPPWRIVDPAPADELLRYYHEAETDFGIPWRYLAAINMVETRFGRIRGASEAGAQGPMQFIPSTWKQYGEGGDINSYRDSIRAAARLLTHNGGPANMRNALHNYNHDDRYVDAVLAFGDEMGKDDAAYRAYYHWQVYYLTTAGDVWLATGYGT
jgi:hypothetical protein